jgi:2-octaprenyl-6-methoxyphenol hydroxylase
MADMIAEVAVVGAGPAGLASALALQRLGMAPVIVAPPYDPVRANADQRTTALIGPSLDFLENIGAWPHCAAEATPFSAVRIADDRGTLVRVPEVLFTAQEIGLAQFGANISNAALLHALHATAHHQAVARVDTAAVTHIEAGRGGVRLEIAEGGSVTAALVVAADGRSSIAPPAAGIAVRSWTYPQAAIAATFAHKRAHGGIVYELHRRSGPLATVPLKGLQSSLVWVEEPDEARRIASLASDAFAELLEERLQGVLGTITDVSPRAIYPLSGATAERMGARRIALVGEAAHVVPPIGAQGLNLGLRDAASLADCVARAKAEGLDIGAARVLDAYHEARSADVAARSGAIDLLNRSLLADFLPLDLARGAVVHMIARSAKLREAFMRGGLGGVGELPRLMRPNAPGA